MAESGSLFPETRVSVIEAMGRGVDAAWATFFSIYGPIIHRFARHAGLAAADADEVLAIVLRNFLVRVRKGDFHVDPEKGRFRHYLRTMTNRTISEYRRGQAGRPVALQDAGPVADVQAEPDADWDELERQERLRACLDRLVTSGRVSPRDLEAFELYVLQERPAEQIARRLGISRSRLYVIKHEVINQLRQLRSELDEILGEV